MISQKTNRPLSRRGLFKSITRIVVKIGSGALTEKDGLNKRVINNITGDICYLKEKSVEVILVSSGAIAAGIRKMGLKKRPESISEQQAVAAIGQSSLMMAYEKAFSRYDQKVAQILITRDDLNHRQRYLNARNTIFTLLSWRITPIINENDTVVVDEIKCGDNDNLSAMVTNLTGAQLLINLTDIDGLYDKDPRTHKGAHFIPKVEKFTQELIGYAGLIPGFLGTGGMASKIQAARKTTLRGVPAIIANGRKRGILKDIYHGHERGTFFSPQKDTLRSRKHWIAFTKSPKGEVIIDDGAKEAIIKKGKSLLPTGIKEVKGRFGLGDSVVLLDKNNQELAVGMVNYTSNDIEKIKGVKSKDIESQLGHKHDDEVIHRDNLVITYDLGEGEDICRSN